MECGFDEAEGGGAGPECSRWFRAALLTRAVSQGVRADRGSSVEGMESSDDVDTARRCKVNEVANVGPRNLGSSGPILSCRERIRRRTSRWAVGDVVPIAVSGIRHAHAALSVRCQCRTPR